MLSKLVQPVNMEQMGQMFEYLSIEWFMPYQDTKTHFQLILPVVCDQIRCTSVCSPTSS